MTTIGILGGTGPAGRGVAVRLANAGCDVVLGSRDSSRAHEVAGSLLPRGRGTISGARNEDAALSGIVIVATPWDSAVTTVRSLKSQLAGKTVVSMVNALAREGRELVPLYPARGSMAAQIAFALPESRIVGAFHHLPAATMEDQDSDLDADVVIFSDHEEDRQHVAAPRASPSPSGPTTRVAEGPRRLYRSVPTMAFRSCHSVSTPSLSSRRVSLPTRWFWRLRR